MKRIIVFVSFIYLFLSAFAKEISISGVAVDSIGNPLAYTDILLKGSNLKIMSDASGKFDVKVNPLQRITFIWCNYKPVRIRIMRSRKVEVIMSINKSYITKIK